MNVSGWISYATVLLVYSYAYKCVKKTRFIIYSRSRCVPRTKSLPRSLRLISAPLLADSYRSIPHRAKAKRSRSIHAHTHTRAHKHIKVIITCTAISNVSRSCLTPWKWKLRAVLMQRGFNCSFLTSLVSRQKKDVLVSRAQRGKCECLWGELQLPLIKALTESHGELPSEASHVLSDQFLTSVAVVGRCPAAYSYYMHLQSQR